MKEYRIKKPRCWVVRWDDYPDDGRDYLGHDSAHVTRKEAPEFATSEEAKEHRRFEAGIPKWWRIVRRGKVSK